MPRKTSKKSEETATAPVDTPAAAPVADDAEAAQEGEQMTVSERMAQLAVDLDKIAKIIKNMASDMKKVRRAHDKEIKTAQKSSKGRRRKAKDPNAPKRPPSGFNKAGPISKELSKFLGEKADVELSRPEVTKKLNKYIKDHDLQNPANKREIVPDKKLSKLLTGPSDGTALTFFNLQKYIKHHFPKPAAAKATASK